MFLPEQQHKSFIAKRTGRDKLDMVAVTFAETALWRSVMAASSLRRLPIPRDPIVL
jgi:hypothetical protein